MPNASTILQMPPTTAQTKVRQCLSNTTCPKKEDKEKPLYVNATRKM